MLRNLGSIFYLLAIICLAVPIAADFEPWSIVTGIAGLLSCLFYGAVCFVLDDIRALLGGNAHSAGRTGSSHPKPIASPKKDAPKIEEELLARPGGVDTMIAQLRGEKGDEGAQV